MTQAPNVLPRGRHAAPREIVRQSQNERMLGAMADAVAEKGYGRASVADVIERAGVSRKTFYEHFANKEECFLAAYDAGADMLLGAIAESVADSLGDWQAAMRTGVRAYLETLAANPAFARTFMHEVLAAGPAALARRTVIMDRFIDQLVVLTEAARAAAPEVPHHPRYVYEASVGASNELVARKLLQDGPQRLPEIADALVDVQLKLLGPRG
jgi:AcrR family transcriptional regulator